MVEKARVKEQLAYLKDSKLKTVIYGVSGSVAAIKAKEICTMLLKHGYNTVLVATPNAMNFLSLEDYSLSELKEEYSISGDLTKPVLLEFCDKDEWAAWTTREDPVLHIELRKIGSLLLIGPLSANTLGKVANGLCDNLLTSVARCWDTKR